MNSKTLKSVLIYLAVFFAIFSFSFWRLRSLAEGHSAGEWFPDQEYTERDPTKPAKPFFSLLTNRSYGTNERPRLWLNYRDIDAIDFRVYRVNDPAKFFHSLDNPHQYGEDEESEFESYFRKRNPTFLEKVRAFKASFYLWFRDYFRSQLKNQSRRRFNQTFRNPDAELEAERTPLNVADYARVPLLNPDQMVSSWREKLPPLTTEYDRRPVPIGKREPGVYVVEAVNGDLRAYGIVMVTDLTMVQKTSRDGSLMVYAVNRQTGAPRAGVKVDVYKGKDSLVSGATDDQGLYRTNVKQQPGAKKTPAAEDEEGEGGEEGEGSDEGVNPSYIIMANERENFAISDLDSYYFGSYGGDEESSAEDLMSYVYTDRPVYRPEQKVFYKGILRRRTQDGYQLPTGAVTVSIEDQTGAKIAERETTLSSRGTFSGEFDIPEGASLGYYSITAETASGMARGSFEVLEYKKPEYKVTVTAPQKFIPTGTQMKFNVSARYFFGAPVARADVKYYIYRERYYPSFFNQPADPIDEFGTEENEEDNTGYYYDAYNDPMVREGEGRTDADGNLAVEFTVPQPSEKEAWDYTYRLEAQVTDPARRVMEGRGEFVGTRGSVVADAETERYVYYEGDTARIIVRSRDYEGRPRPAQVSLKFVEQTWERIEKNDYGNTYYDYKLKERDLSSGSVQTNDQGEAFYDYRVERPGNIQIKTVVNEGGKQITSLGGSIWVADRGSTFTDYSYQGEAQIKLVPDKKTYRVGETAHVMALLPTDKAHLLVTTELMNVMQVRQVSTTGRAVVLDIPIEARYAPNVFLAVTYVRGGEMHTGEASIVVPPRDKLLKLEIIPDKNELKPRETVSYTIVARDGDGKPAANAEVSLGVVDEAIYSVRGENMGDIRRDFYGRRYNEVNTAFSTNFTFTGYAGTKPIQLAQTKRTNQLADLKNESDLVEPLVRKIFKDTAYWQPAVLTNAEGKATVKVELPDNLTTWRATARAVTADTKVGATTSKVLSRKDVLIRMAMPRFLTAGDQVTFSGIVHNYLKQEKTTQISLQLQGAQLLDPPTQTVTIPANGEHRVNWRVSAPQTGDITLLAKALTDAESDAVELRMPIVPRGLKQTRGQVVTLAGDGDEERTVTLNLPANTDPRARTLRIEAAPSVAATLFGALDYLTSYPYGCVEQTMSSFLPTVVVANALREVDRASIRDTNNINRKVKKGLDRLAKFQHDDGGWGWWADDKTDAWMTAYVVDGLLMASRAGYQIDDGRVQMARGKLVSLLDAGRDDSGKETGTETRAYMIYALQQSGGADARFIDQMFDNRGRLQPYGRALLALTLRARGDQNRARQLAAEIERTAAQSDFDAHWASRRQIAENYTEENNIEATALSVKALALINPQSPLLPKAARWLAQSRNNGRFWVSTRQTAFAIYGLTDYLRVSQELSPDYALEVYVGNEQVLSQQVTAAEAGRAQSFTVTRKNEQVGASTPVRVVKRGRGVVYLSATVDFSTTEEQTAPQSASGMKINREYLRLRLEQDGDRVKWRTEQIGNELRSGEMIVVRLTIEGNPAPYLLIEDPIPAGCEQVEAVGALDLSRTAEGWTDWYNAREFRDERTAFFLDWFDGKATFQYAMRVQEPGDFRVGPARVELMYQPNVQSNTASGRLTILDRK
ncbi:MAG TPA: MG2 domain-containing protein [Pyrinomonadaceae bacterium]|nr:MG2 domain-containing protein [Pyrinomonadaceae bacterium]